LLFIFKNIAFKVIPNMVLNILCGFLALEEDDIGRYNVNPIINTLTTVGGFYRSFIGNLMTIFICFHKDFKVIF